MATKNTDENKIPPLLNLIVSSKRKDVTRYVGIRDEKMKRDGTNPMVGKGRIKIGHNVEKYI